MIPGGSFDHITCRDCGAPVCDEACPSAQAVDHERILAEIDAYEDHMATTYPDERWAA
jgi:hypothetical protein